MEQSNDDINFQGKWKREIPIIRHKEYRRKRKKNKNIWLKILNDFVNVFKIKKQNKKNIKRVNPKREKSREAHEFTTRFILKRAIKNSFDDIRSTLNSFKFKNKSKRLKTLRLGQKLSKKRKDKLIEEIKSFLNFFKKKNISKDEIFFRKKNREKRINELKDRLKRYSQFKFRDKKKSTSEIVKRRLLREKRKKLILNFLKNIKTLPSRSINNLIKSYKDFKIFFKKSRKNIKSTIEYIHFIKSDRELKRKLLFTYFNSTVALLFSYTSIYYLNQLITVIVSSTFSIPTVLYYFDIIYQIGPYSSLWNRFNIIVINGSAPFFSLLLAVIFYRFYKISKNNLKYFRLFFFWGMVFSFNMFFGAYIVGAITRSGFIYFTEWIFYSYMFDIEEIVFIVTSLIALVAIGYFAAHFVLTIADTKLLITSKNKPYYKIMQLFMPYITVFFIVNVFSFPNITFYNILLQLTLLFVIIPAMINYENYRTSQIVIIKSKQNFTFLKWSLIVTLVFYLSIRILLNDGIWFS